MLSRIRDSRFLKYSSILNAIKVFDEPFNFCSLQMKAQARGSESENQVVKGLCAFVLAICLQSNDDTVEKSNRFADLIVMLLFCA